MADPSPLDHARRYVALGISVLPIKPDGSKAPDASMLPDVQDPDTGKYRPTWLPYQQRLADEAELRRWLQDGLRGLAIICGAVSGGLEVLDFEKWQSFALWRQLVADESPALLHRLMIARTPGGGAHVYYRCAQVQGNQKLAWEEDPEKPGRKRILIETRGEGGYVLAVGCPGSCHPTGRTYEHVEGTPDVPQEVTDEEREILLAFARSLSTWEEPEKTDRRVSLPGMDGLKPGEDFIRRGPRMRELLEENGWKFLYRHGERDYYRRPGKDRGSCSATVSVKNGIEKLHVFSTNADPFDAEESYNAFFVYAYLNHGKDFSAAAKALGEKGYGEQRKEKTRQVAREAQMNGQSATGTGTPPPKSGPAAEAKKRPARRRAVPPFMPFPLHCLPEPLRSYVVQTATVLNCDPAYVALPVLGTVAGAIGNSRSVRLLPDWEEPCILWPVVVAESGTMKSPAWVKATGFLFAYDHKLCQEYAQVRRVYEEQLDEWKENRRAFRTGRGPDPGGRPAEPAQNRALVSDVTMERLAELLQANPRGLLLAVDELTSWLNSFNRYKGNAGGTDLPNWLSIHRAGSIRVDRKSQDRSPISVARAAVSVAGTIQPAILARVLTNDFLESGLAARLLLAMPPRLPKVWTKMEVHPDVKMAYKALLTSLLLLEMEKHPTEGLRPLALPLSDDADREWGAWYADWSREQMEVEGDLASAFSKLEAAAGRIALVYSVVRDVVAGANAAGPIDATSILAGVELARWFAYEARRVYSMLSESDNERLERRLVEYIQSRGGKITVRELQRSNQRKYPTSEAAEAVLAELVQDGAAKWVPIPSEGGRPSKALVLLNHGVCDTSDRSTQDGEPEAKAAPVV